MPVIHTPKCRHPGHRCLSSTVLSYRRISPGNSERKRFARTKGHHWLVIRGWRPRSSGHEFSGVFGIARIRLLRAWLERTEAYPVALRGARRCWGAKATTPDARGQSECAWGCARVGRSDGTRGPVFEWRVVRVLRRIIRVLPA